MAIDDAAKYRERKRRMDMLKPLLKRLNSADDIKALSCAAWARHDSYSARATAKRFQDFIADPNFLLRFGGKGDADGVADPGHAPTLGRGSGRGGDGPYGRIRGGAL